MGKIFARREKTERHKSVLEDIDEQRIRKGEHRGSQFDYCFTEVDGFYYLVDGSFMFYSIFGKTARKYNLESRIRDCMGRKVLSNCFPSLLVYTLCAMLLKFKCKQSERFFSFEYSFYKILYSFLYRVRA